MLRTTADVKKRPPNRLLDCVETPHDVSGVYEITVVAESQRKLLVYCDHGESEPTRDPGWLVRL